MSDTKQLLERARRQFPPPGDVFGNLERRRERKRRNQRIVAGVVGIGLFAAFVIAGDLIRSSSGVGPADQTPTPTLSVQPSLPAMLSPTESLAQTGGGIDAVDRGTGEHRTIVDCTDPCQYINSYGLSADGRWLAYEIGTCLAGPPCDPAAGLWVTNAVGDEQQITHVCRADRCWGESWAWSLEGATLAVGGTPKPAEVFTFDPSNGVITALEDSDQQASTLAWSPDGTQLAIALGPPNNEVEMIDVATRDKRVLATQTGQVDKLARSPDGSRVVLDEFKNGRNHVVVLQPSGGEPLTLVDQGELQGPAAPAWSPDGTRIAFVTTPQQAGETLGHFWFEVWVIGADGSNRTRVFSGDCCIEDWDGPVWSPDGSRVAFFDDVDVDYGTWLVVNADGTGSAERIDEADVHSWSS